MFHMRFLPPTDQKCAESSTYWEFFYHRPPGKFRFTHLGEIAKMLCQELYIYIYIAARRAYNNRVPLLRARARQPRFGSSMQYCIRSLISITNVQKYCKRAKVCASLLLWHFKTIRIENICLLFIEVHCSNQQKPFHFAHRVFSYFLI